MLVGWMEMAQDAGGGPWDTGWGRGVGGVRRTKRVKASINCAVQLAWEGSVGTSMGPSVGVGRHLDGPSLLLVWLNEESDSFCVRRSSA